MFFRHQIFEQSSSQVVDWAFHAILDKHSFIVNNVAYGLARSGRLDYLKVLRDRGILATKHHSISVFCTAALHSGSLATVQWLFENKLHPPKSSTIWSNNTQIPARRGNLEVLKYLYEHGCAVINEATFSAAARGGHMHIIQWLLDMGCTMSPSACAAAAEAGNLELLKWLRKNGCKWDEDSCASAACGGHYQILKWLRENGCEWNSQTCFYIARRGDLGMLKWANSNGCILNVDVASGAATNGHLEILKYLQEQGIRYTNGGSSVTARGHLHVLKWLNEFGFQWTHFELIQAIRYGHLDVVKWLIEEIKFEVDSYVILDAVIYGQLEVLKYLVEIGGKLGEDYCTKAAERGYLKMLQWLVDNGCPWNKQKLEKIAVNRKRLREWLLKIITLIINFYIKLNLHCENILF